MPAHVNALQRDYWEESVQPLACLYFVAPLLLLYEVGVVWLGPAAMRNGADVWLRQGLAELGFAAYFFLPLVTCSILLGWHHVTRRDWKVRVDVLSGMVCECATLGLCVLVFAQVFARVMHAPLSLDDHVTALIDSDRLPYLLSYLGAGIYEELLFRLFLLTTTICVCQHLGADKRSAIWLGVLSTSLLFAAAHYRLFFAVGGEFTWFSFAFRLTAGALFCMLFLQRGFGIAVGTHAVYDILVAAVCSAG